MLLIDHLRYRRYLDAHVDDELTGGLATRIAIHVATCPMCEREAVVTVHIKDSFARLRNIIGRAENRIRHWNRTDPN